MAPSSSKGKEKAIYDGKGSGKRKRGFKNDDKLGGGKRRNRQALQFFEDAAYEVGDDEDDDSDDSFFNDGFLEDEFDIGDKFQKEPSRTSFMPFVLKEEEPTEEELEKLLQERYKPGSSFVTHAEDNYESKKSFDIDEGWPSIKEPTIWKVKCVVGRERHSAFCLMQKYVDLKYLGNKLQIISAFSVDHIKGFIYVEADTQQHIYEACNGLSNIYSTRVAPVPRDDVSYLFTIRSMGMNISEGMWARVKNGKYKGDLAQVAAVNDARKKVTVKLVPRIDMKALAEKIGRGTTANRAVTPAPRLISSKELEEFRPLIQFRRDRDTNKMFEVLDGMMLKDGYLYKKVSVDSLSFWGVTPKDDEVLKFEPSKNDESKDLEFLSQLYGERKKKRPLICDKGGGKGDGSSSSSVDNNFEVNDLVFFGRKDFGVIIGSEKDGLFKIIKSGSEGPVIVTLQKRDLKNALFDKKLFTALDPQAKNISINDTVRVVEGSLKDREGIVKRIYRGIIFLYNETVEENNGYFCTKAPMCEKVELPVETSNEKNGEPGPSGFGDFTSSPRSPLSPKQSDQGRDGSRNFKREDDAMFSVGQSVRIRVGPLKGYLCRVLAIRRSDVTVKLHSHHRVLTVKCEHLSEVRSRTAGISFGEGSDSVKPFDLLGTQDGSTDWMDGASKAAEGGSWNAGGFSTERSSWPSFPASNSSLQPESDSFIPLKAVDDDANKDASWDTKPTRGQGSSWGISATARGASSESVQVDGWGNHDGGKKGAFTTGSGSSASDGWGKAVELLNQATGKELEEDSWGRAAENLSIKDDSGGGKSTWDASGVVSAKPTLGWGNTGGSSDKTGTTPWNKASTSDEGPTDGWATMKKDGEGTGVCGKGAETSAWNQNAGVSGGSSSWNKQDLETSCSKQSGGSSWNKPDGGSSSWRKQDGGQTVGWVSTKKDGEGTGAWGKGAETSSQSQNTGVMGGSSSWNKQDAETVCIRQGCGSSWNKPEGGSSSWSKQDGGSSSWSKQGGGSSSWSKPEGGSSSWSKDGVAMENTGDIDQPRGWGRSESFNGGRGSGGRRGRGGGRGGRGQFGRESSFGQDETSSWTKSDQRDGGSKAGTLEGNNSVWGKDLAFNQDKVNDSWDKPNTSSVDGSKWAKGSGSNEGTTQWGGKSGNGWSDGRAKDQDGNKGCFGNESKLPDESCPSGWSKKSVSNDQNCDSKGQGGTWNKGGISAANQPSGWGNKAIDSGREQSDWDNKLVANAPGDNQSSGWNTAASQEAGGGGWEKKETPAGNSKSAWKTSTSFLDGNQSSAWGGKSDWDAQKASLDNTSRWDQKSAGSKMVVEVDKGGAWNNKITSDGGSSSGWGQSKWDGGTDAGGGSSSGWGQSKRSGAADACGNENSWSNRNNWKSENNFGSSAEQIDKSDDRGGGGNWRGGRGGRWGQDRGGFRGGRGGSERGGFRGRGGSDWGDFGGRGRSDRGRGFGGRGRSDGGDFVGRGGSDGGGFRGRGGFGGRGRGRRDDWNKNDSGEDNAPYSWNNTSNKDASRTSNASAGHWSGGVVNTGKWQSGSSGWNASEGVSEGRNDTQGGGWNKGVGSSKDAGWSDTQGGGWKSTSNKDFGGSNDKSTGWNSKESNCKMSNSSGWNDSVGVAAGGNDTQGSGWNKGVGLPQGSAWKNTSNKDVSGNDDKSNGKISNSSGEATSSGWNNHAAGGCPGSSADASWKAASSSWSQKNDGGDKGGW